MDQESLRINHEVSIPLSELSFRFSRSSGPGGQHVQKSSTRVELLFDVVNSTSLNEEQRRRVQRRLRGYIDSTGTLRLVSQSERSQWRNREQVVARFQTMMQQALKPRRRRKATRPTAASKERRLRQKRQRSEIKKGRGKVGEQE